MIRYWIELVTKFRCEFSTGSFKSRFGRRKESLVSSRDVVARFNALVNRISSPLLHRGSSHCVVRTRGYPVSDRVPPWPWYDSFRGRSRHQRTQRRLRHLCVQIVAAFSSLAPPSSKQQPVAPTPEILFCQIDVADDEIAANEDLCASATRSMCRRFVPTGEIGRTVF